MAIRRFHYHLVDVFTDRPFGGNPLAVFSDGRGIPDPTMQAIAKELNLSETTFVLPPQKAGNDFQVRIFTPGAELPMAGHPTIGTTFVLCREGLVRPNQDRIVLEEGVGPIPVAIGWENNAPAFIEMQQPLPEFGGVIEETDGIAEMLSLEPAAIRETNLPVQMISCGVPYLLVPLRDLKAIQQIRFRADLLDRVLSDRAPHEVLVFTREVQFADSQIHSRMFAPALGVGEDPATGSAAGPLGCYLVRHQVIQSESELRCVSEQGIEMGRPSFLHIRIAHQGEKITAVRVGGTCHYMGAGHLDLDLD